MTLRRTIDLFRAKFWVHIPVAIVGAAVLLHAQGSNETPPLMQKYDCLSCHRPDTKLVGPAFHDIAKRYTMADLSTLVKKVKTGGSGNWGAIPMIPHPTVPDADIQKLVTWILSSNKPASKTAAGQQETESESSQATHSVASANTGIDTSVLKLGATVYRRDCIACHGIAGDGQGRAAPYLYPHPRDFTMGQFKFRSTPSGSLPTDEDLLRTLDRGVPGTQMPSWKNLLTENEKHAVVAYLKTFFSAAGTVAAPISIPEVPADMGSNVREGKYVFMLMECWTCHGPQGLGNGMLADSLKDAWGDIIHPRNLTHLPYKAGSDPQTIYRTLSTGMNGTPMPVFDDSRMLISSNYSVDSARFRQAYSGYEIHELKEWLRAQPNESSLQNMGGEPKRQLAQARKWALISYVESLAKRPNFFVRMFTENTEITH